MKDRIEYAFALGCAFGMGRAWAKANLGSLAQDADRWITVKPNGSENTGRPVLIDENTGKVKAGIGGKWNGKTLNPKKTKSSAKKKIAYKNRSEMTPAEREADDALIDETRSVRSFKYFGGKNIRLTILRSDDDAEAYLMAFDKEGQVIHRTERLYLSNDVSNAEIISKFSNDVEKSKELIKQNVSATELKKQSGRQARRKKWEDKITKELDLESAVIKNLASDYKSVIKEKFENGTALARDAYLKVQPALVFKGFTLGGEVASFSVNDEGFQEGVKFSGNYLARRDKNNIKLESDCAEFFHENGHHVDWALSSDRKTFLSDEENFTDTIMEEVNGLYDEYGLGTNDVNIKVEFEKLRALEMPQLFDAYKSRWEKFGIEPEDFLNLVKDEAATDETTRSFLLSCAIARRHDLQPEETGVFSDMMMPFISNDNWRPRVYKMGLPVMCLFHYAGYFSKNIARVGRETFANLFEVAMTNPIAYQKYAKIFPKTHKEFERLLTL